MIDISDLIENIALNKFQIEIENDYIDYLINEIYKKNNDLDKIKELEKYKRYNNLYQEFSSDYFYLFSFQCGMKD